MNFFTLTAANIRFRPLTAFFNVILLAMGISTILTLIQLERQLSNSFTRDLKGIDLVVSGKGSPLQIILSSVFHIDIPTGNISLKEAELITQNPLVKSAIPLALGDNFNGFRIVGTTPAYISHYDGVVLQGRIYSTEMEVVVGAEVAKTQALKIGDKIIGAHGLVGSDDLHTDQPYTVTGILAPTGSVLDRLVLTPVESVWHVHEEEEHEHAGHEPHEVESQADREYTALLVTYNSPLAAAQLPRLINKTGALQAASPAFEVARLNKITTTGTDILSIFGVMLVGFSAMSFFVALSTAINDRLYDIVLMRTLGASRLRISQQIFGEALLLGGVGTLLGFAAAHILTRLIGAYIQATQHIILEGAIFTRIDLAVFIGGLAVSGGAAILPALRAYRIDPVATLKRS